MNEAQRKQFFELSEQVNEEMAVLWAAGTNIGDKMDKLDNLAALGFHIQLERLSAAVNKLQELILLTVKQKEKTLPQS